MKELPLNQVIVGDALAQLRTLPDESVDCVVTSPPYFGLRDYGVDGQVGLEPSVEQWVRRLVLVATEIRRVLVPSGSLWLNMGDSYSRRHHHGAPPKSLLLGPERVLLALVREGWLVRNKVVWAKPNAMPASVRDRLTPSWEPLYLLVRSRHYFFDLDAIREPHRTPLGTRRSERVQRSRRPAWAGPLAGDQSGLARMHAKGMVGHPLGRNPRDVWTISTTSRRDGHHAAFPETLIERPVSATCPERVCSRCNLPWERAHPPPNGNHHLRPRCNCDAAWRPGIVLDPFVGSGTTAVVAERLGREWIGIELNPTFAHKALQRVQQQRLTRQMAS